MSTVRLPQLSLAMEGGRIVRWLVAEGANVDAGEPVVEVETDKATIEVEAPSSGVIRIVAAPGSDVAVAGVLAEIDGGDSGTTIPLAPTEVVEAPTPATPPIASPAARRLAAERGVDLARVQGSGEGGRITAQDVENAAATSGKRGGSDVRRAVIAGLVASWREIPHIHIGGELDAELLVEATQLPRMSSGPAATISDALVAALVIALREVPELNGTVLGGVASPSPSVDLAYAVATSQGVVAPVLRGAERRSLSELAAERKRLVAAAREGRLPPDAFALATVTLSNLGAYPVDFFAPIVFGPQIATVAIGRVRPVAAVVDGAVAIRSRAWVNVAFDHRAADGEAGARFLGAFERAFVTVAGEWGAT